VAPSAVSASPPAPSAPGQSSREPRSLPTPTVLVVAVVVAAAALAAVGAVLLAHSNGDLDRAGLRAAMVDWIVVPYVLGGLIAWRRRPESRFGVLMIAAGLAMAATTFQWSPNRLVSTIGQLVDLLPAVVFAHVFLAFPDGRLGRPPERLLVGVGYVTAVGGSLLVLVLGGFDARNLLALTSNPGAAEAVQNVQLLVLAAVNLLGVLLLSRSRRGAGHAPRRLLALLADSFSLGLITFAALLVAGVFALPGFEQLRLVTFGVLGLAPVAFLGALLDARLARSGVAGLLVELHDHPAADLRDPLARALRDPTLTVAYWLPQYGAWADEAGNPVPVPDPDPRRSVRVIDRDGEHVAALLYDRSLQDEDELVAAVSAAADIALENGRLQAELHARLQELHSSRTRVIEAGQRERQRLERNLHDGAQQRLVAVSLELAVLRERLSEDADASGRVDEMKREVALSLDELRDLARGLHPAVLSGHGLAVALDSLAAKAPVPVRLSMDLRRRLPDAVEVAAYYVVSESIVNVGKHAGAASVTIDVRELDARLIVEIIDDGGGGADTEAGSGLRGLADRVEALNGRLRVWSPVGGGTRVRAEIPCG
jgi:signal transduction histidine kinase